MAQRASARPRGRHVVFGALAVLALLVIAIAAGGAWLLYTQSGLRWSLERAAALAPGKLEVADARGTWASGWSAQRLAYASEALSAEATGLQLALSPLSLARLALRIDTLAAQRVVIRLPQGNDEPAKPPDTLALPLRVDVADARIGELVVEQPTGHQTLRNVRASYAGGPQRHELRALHAEHELATVDASGTLGAAAPFPLDASIAATVQQPLPARVQAKLGGSLEDMQLAGTLTDGAARAEVQVLVAPFSPTPIRRARVDASGIDLHRYADALPATGLALAATVEAKDGAWRGPLEVKNAAPGAWDKQRLPVQALTAELALEAEPLAARFDALRLDLGAAGEVTGSATVRRDGADLALATRRLDLRGLYSKLRQTALKGRVDARLAGASQHASGVLAQDDIELAFDARRTGDDVELRRFVARSRGSTLSGKARLDLAGAQPYSAQAVLKHFDPAAWGDFPSGNLNGEVQASGSLARQAIKLVYRLDDSRLLGARLEGAGRFTYAAERISDADVRLALGGNRLHATGNFGARGDELALAIDAPRLSVLDARASGAVSGRAKLSGTWRSPRGTVDVTGNRLAYAKDARIDALSVQGRLDSLEQGRFEVKAEARGLSLQGWRGERIAVNGSGSLAQHVLHAEARGGDLDLAVDARGGWQNQRWRGVVSRLENRGEFAFRLESPVEVAAAAQSVHLGRFQATLMAGTLDVSRVDYEAGSLRSEGNFSRLPVRPLMALAGLPTGARDTLRLSGSWNFAAAPRIQASFAVQRESGDLALGGDHPLPLGLDTLRIDGRLVNDRLQVNAELRSVLASASGEGSIGALPGAGGGITFAARSPIAFSVSADVARLAAFGGMFENTTAYFDGRMHADLRGRGTLGAPVITGAVSGDQLALALPPQGIALDNGTLSARIADNRIALDRFEMHGGEGTLTAQGSLSLAEGQRASVDWRADNLRILGRPDRRLVITGSGNAALENGKLALTGKVRANAGLFQFGETDLPTLGPDVVVAGQTRAPEEKAALKNATLKLAIDLGNDLHIVGHGLDAWIEGNVLLHTGGAGELLADGTVLTQRGRYTAFGQRLQIDRGRLLFNGAVDNPGLDVVAMRKNQAVEAGVAVTGTVQSPVVRIVSEPPVPEGEALSWLVLGHGPADASRADLAMLPLAAAALFGQGKPGADSFASKLGLDTLSLKGSTTLANNVVAVGKRFSRNLYVAYEQSLGGIANVLKVELNLTRRVLLRAEAGQVSAAGLFFRWAFD